MCRTRCNFSQKLTLHIVFRPSAFQHIHSSSLLAGGGWGYFLFNFLFLCERAVMVENWVAYVWVKFSRSSQSSSEGSFSNINKKVCSLIAYICWFNLSTVWLMRVQPLQIQRTVADVSLLNHHSEFSLLRWQLLLKLGLFSAEYPAG